MESLVSILLCHNVMFLASWHLASCSGGEGGYKLAMYREQNKNVGSGEGGAKLYRVQLELYYCGIAKFYHVQLVVQCKGATLYSVQARPPISPYLPARHVSHCLSVTCASEWVICNFFWYLCCFRQGFMRVTLRNKKNIGLICFMLVSSSDFGLLCCTITHYNYKGKMAKISPKIHKIEIWPKSRPKVINSPNKSHRDHIWGMFEL